LKMLLQRRIDGILLVPVSNDPTQVDRIQKQGIPVVLLDRRVPNIKVDLVCGDSESGAYKLTQHLLSLGHRRISMLTGPMNVSTAVDRVNGFRRALAEAGIPNTDDQVVWGHFSQKSGYEMAQAALSTVTIPTALFTVNNFVAIGAFAYLRQAGLSVPEDLSVVTFDEVPNSLMSESFLTSAQQPAE